MMFGCEYPPSGRPPYYTRCPTEIANIVTGVENAYSPSPLRSSSRTSPRTRCITPRFEGRRLVEVREVLQEAVAAREVELVVERRVIR